MPVVQTTDSKAVIRQSARQMFRERGYAATSMRDIARAAGMEAPSIYSHFNSKEHILQDICFGMAQVFFSSIETVLEAETNAAEKLRAAIHAHARVILNNIEESNVFFNEWIFLSEPHLTEFKKQRNRYERHFRSIVEAGISSGNFRPVNVRLATFTILSSLNSIFELNKSDLNTGETGNMIADILLNGILKP